MQNQKIALGGRSPEKAWRRRFNSIPGHHVFNSLAGAENPKLLSIGDKIIMEAQAPFQFTIPPTRAAFARYHREQIELSKLIDIVNRGSVPSSSLRTSFFDQIREEAVADTYIQQAAMVNSLENFGCVFDRALEGKFIDRMDQNHARYMNDRKFAKVVADFLRKQVYEQIREEVEQDAARRPPGAALCASGRCRTQRSYQQLKITN